jgi:N-acetylglucosamine kinase-like BadF-type ATPase
MENRCFLGVDGGASSTRALLIDRTGAVRGHGSGGNGNHQGQGYAAALAHVAAAVHDACAQAGIDLGDIFHAHFALAGDDVEDDELHLSEGLRRIFPGLRFNLTNDVFAGLRAGAPHGFGVAVNCGSGCGAAGRNPQGTAMLIPDLGYQFGDSGGGVQIARDAVRAVIRAWQGRGPATALTEAVLDLFEQPDVKALYTALYRAAAHHDHLIEQKFRRLTREVLRLARDGDEPALDIVRHIGAELGVAGGALARRLGMTELSFPFVLTGGTFRTLDSALARAAVLGMRITAPGAAPTLPLVMPVAGAALLALDAAEIPVEESHYQALRASGQGWHAEDLYAL